jgi:large subunit ribosomal protein L6
MSRVASNPVTVPNGVEIKLDGRDLSVKGSKGTLQMIVHTGVEVTQEDSKLKFVAKDKDSIPMSGTTRALVNNMVVGVTNGFEKKLLLNGVGYRCAVQGKKLNLTLGFSHPVVYELPEGISAETPSQTEIVIKGIDKQAVGQAAAEIRAFRPPEPYKGKGVRYADEHVRRKEAKKK